MKNDKDYLSKIKIVSINKSKIIYSIPVKNVPSFETVIKLINGNLI
ncbi:hypothetical protein SAMN05421639_101821 [Chryseobacterium shigense]|uniref:Uncharacterized protein n=1 Tax=Chryseobacterium shigense TaxID=297244 RepID=A0A1N7HZP0_9FLAO|nr:hypothetical protein SAMN05421639_101821 [Chryseobacterium shigense]